MTFLLFTHHNTLTKTLSQAYFLVSDLFKTNPFKLFGKKFKIPRVQVLHIGCKTKLTLVHYRVSRQVVPFNIESKFWIRGSALLYKIRSNWIAIDLRSIRFIGWILTQLFIRGSVGLKEQDVISRVKQYFELVEILNNLEGLTY